jgi:SNF2 family DNA or RNA helicase
MNEIRALPWPGRPLPFENEFFVTRREMIVNNWCGESITNAYFDSFLYLNGKKIQYREVTQQYCRDKLADLISPLWRLSITHLRQGCENVRFFVDIFVNMDELILLIQSGKRFKGRSFLIHHAILAYKHHETHLDNFILERSFPVDKFLNVSRDLETILNKPSQFKLPYDSVHLSDEIGLYDFQKASLSKMIILENNLHKMNRVNADFVRIGVNSRSVYVSTDMDLLLDNECSKRSCNVAGGLLTDRMGMGKTLTLISLCESQRLTEDKQDMKPASTLVICPAHVLTHWAQEITKYTKSSSITIATKDDMKKTSVGTIMSGIYDYVIVSFNLFSNGFMKESTEYYYSKIGYNCYESMYQRIQNIKRDYFKLTGSERLAHHFLPCLFNWGRTIVDEFHELGNAVHSQALTYIACISSKFTWLVSGTPTVNIGTTSKVLIHNLFTRSNIPIYDSCVNILENCTVNNASYDVDIPNIYENIKWVEFTKDERQLYDALANEERAHQLRVCSYPRVSQISSHKMKEVETVEEMKECAISHLRKRLHNTKEMIDERERVLHELPQNDGTSRVNQLRREYSKEITDLKIVLEGLIRTEKYVTSTSSDDCVICLQSIEDPAMLRNCGHTFCKQCCYQFLTVDTRCPTCREPAVPKDIITLSKTHESIDIESLRRQYGSKLAHLITYLKDTNDVKTLIFSQWDDFLRDIGRCIEKFSRVLYCRGNVNAKRSSIHKFMTSKKCNLLLLSTLNSGSGCDLSIASRVILIDTLDGGPEVTEIERQAIARCHRIGQTKNVEIVRFIMKDSIEERIYTSRFRGCS